MFCPLKFSRNILIEDTEYDYNGRDEIAKRITRKIEDEYQCEEIKCAWWVENEYYYEGSEDKEGYCAVREIIWSLHDLRQHDD